MKKQLKNSNHRRRCNMGLSALEGRSVKQAKLRTAAFAPGPAGVGVSLKDNLVVGEQGGKIESMKVQDGCLLVTTKSKVELGIPLTEVISFILFPEKNA